MGRKSTDADGRVWEFSSRNQWNSAFAEAQRECSGLSFVRVFHCGLLPSGLGGVQYMGQTFPLSIRIPGTARFEDVRYDGSQQ
jgi:hypothetical protein